MKIKMRSLVWMSESESEVADVVVSGDLGKKMYFGLKRGKIDVSQLNYIAPKSHWPM